MKKNKIFLIIAVLGLAVGACDYAFVIPEEAPPLDDGSGEPVVVSFSEDILPIFNNDNHCTQCHNTGGTAPDLSAEKAYQSLNNSKYINTESPDQSLIYNYLIPTATTHTRKHYTATEAQYVLVWIEQGAKNN